MELPITLPDGWSAEDDPVLGAIITGFDSNDRRGFVTISELKRSFEPGMSVVRQRVHYSGRYRRKELYQDAVAALQGVLS